MRKANKAYVKQIQTRPHPHSLAAKSHCPRAGGGGNTTPSAWALPSGGEVPFLAALCSSVRTPAVVANGHISHFTISQSDSHSVAFHYRKGIAWGRS